MHCIVILLMTNILRDNNAIGVNRSRRGIPDLYRMSCICIECPVSGGDNGIICEDLTNSPQQQSEEITITV